MRTRSTTCHTKRDINLLDRRGTLHGSRSSRPCRALGRVLFLSCLLRLSSVFPRWEHTHALAAITSHHITVQFPHSHERRSSKSRSSLVCILHPCLLRQMGMGWMDEVHVRRISGQPRWSSRHSDKMKRAANAVQCNAMQFSAASLHPSYLFQPASHMWRSWVPGVP